MAETPHTVLALDVYNDKIKHLLEPDTHPWHGRIHFHRLNIKHDSRLEGLIKMADLVGENNPQTKNTLFLFLSLMGFFFCNQNCVFVCCFFFSDD